MSTFEFEAVDYVNLEIDSMIDDTYLASADQDYVVARWSFENELYSNFLWSSAQCVEKYLKCILLHHRISVRELDHNLITAWTLVQKKCPHIVIAPFYDVPQITGKHFRCSDDTPGKFVEGLNDTGDPDVRYLQIHFSLDFSDLMKLDQLVFSLRKNCFGPAPWQPNDNWEPINPLEKNQPALRWSELRWNQRGEFLEKLKTSFKGQDRATGAEHAFLFLNYPFEGFVPPRANLAWASRTSAIRRVLDRHEGELADTLVDETQTKDVLDWALAHMRLSGKLKRRIEAVLAKGGTAKREI